MADIETGPHHVRLAALDFDGPLDLLVYLVQKNEVDIYDIPIALIAEQFLAHVESMTAERLEDAGEFLLMAATLLRIKARMLLPGAEADEEEVEDPRRELVLKIIEYQQFKEIADHLREHESEGRLVFPRGNPEWDPDEALDEAPAVPPETSRATLSDLLRAFAVVMRQLQADHVHHFEAVLITIDDKVRFIRRQLLQRGRTTFDELFVPEEPRAYWIVTFVALLEMAREGQVRLRQGDTFGVIHVYPGAAGVQ